MSYNPATGIYSLPAVYLAVPGTVIIAAQHNTPLEDLATANNYARPIIAGGTGSGTKIGAANSLEVVSYTGVQVLSDAQKAQARSNIDAEQSGGVYVSKTGNYKILATDNKTTFQWTGNGTITFDPAATLGANFECVIWANTGVTLILDPDASETINGAASLLVQGGQSVDIWCNGTAFFAKPTSDSLTGPQLQGYSFGLGLSTAADAANDITIATGAAAADTANYDLMQLTSALTKQIDAAWAVGNNAGGLDTGSVGNNTYYIWLIRRPDTGVVDVCFSLSSTAPTTGGNIPSAYTQKRRIGFLVRTSAVNGAPYPVDKISYSGTAPLFAVRAWVNFNGTGTVAIRNSGNVSSITDNGTGNYTVNFLIALPDADFAAVATAMRSTGALPTNGAVVKIYPNASSYTTTAIRIATDDGTSATDMEYVNVIVVR